MTKTFSFAGYTVKKNDDGSFSVMTPFNNHQGSRRYRENTGFATMVDVRSFIHAL